MKLFETERLIIEEAQLADAPFYFELFNSPGWITHIGDRGIKTLLDAEAYIADKIRPAYSEFGFGFYKMIWKANNRSIGTVGLIKRSNLEHVDIGYALLPEYEGKGFTTEGAKAMLDHAMNTLNMDPVLGITSPDNYASQRILEKLGLQKIDAIVWDDGSDAWIYSTTYDSV